MKLSSRLTCGTIRSPKEKGYQIYGFRQKDLKYNYEDVKDKLGLSTCKINHPLSCVSWTQHQTLYVIAFAGLSYPY